MLEKIKLKKTDIVGEIVGEYPSGQTCTINPGDGPHYTISIEGQTSFISGKLFDLVFVKLPPLDTTAKEVKELQAALDKIIAPAKVAEPKKVATKKVVKK